MSLRIAIHAVHIGIVGGEKEPGPEVGAGRAERRSSWAGASQFSEHAIYLMLAAIGIQQHLMAAVLPKKATPHSHTVDRASRHTGRGEATQDIRIRGA